MLPLIPIAMQLGQFVPGIIKLITGSDKAEEVAGKVIDIAKTVTGISDPVAAVEALKVDPTKMMEFNLQIGAQQLEWEKMYLVDKADARAMQKAALAQEDVFSKRFVYYFAIGWSLFAMVYFSAITFIELPAEGRRVADTILGVLIGTVLVGIFHYLYGSTQSSKSKDVTIASMTK